VVYTDTSYVIPDNYRRVWDVSDLVVPASENEAVFLTTNLVITPNQTRGLCSEVSILKWKSEKIWIQFLLIWIWKTVFTVVKFPCRIHKSKEHYVIQCWMIALRVSLWLLGMGLWLVNAFLVPSMQVSMYVRLKPGVQSKWTIYHCKFHLTLCTLEEK